MPLSLGFFLNQNVLLSAIIISPLPMSPFTSEVWTCPRCGTGQDISHLGFFTKMACIGCGAAFHVHCKLDTFQLNGVVGVGGMSIVLRGHDPVLERDVAIKLLNEKYRGDAERIAQFENECSLMAKVRHENVVSLYSAGRAGGQFYIVMELVEGRNLELLAAERNTLPPLEALDIAYQIAKGLQAVYAAGMLHRDVKPGNVLITPEGQAKVLDFGLSLEHDDDGAEDEIIWATPFYAAPETLEREPEDVRSDIYALGMTLRNLLTGENTLPGNPQNVQAMLQAKSMMPYIGEQYDEIPASLCELVEYMTAYKPEERPEDYDEVLAEMEAVRRGMVGAPPREPYVRKKTSRFVAMGACASVFLGIAGAIAISLQRDAGVYVQPLSVSALQWEDLELLHNVERDMQTGNGAKAADDMKYLGTRAKEPAIRLAAVLYSGMQDVLANNGMQTCLRRLGPVVRTNSYVAPAAEAFFSNVKELSAALVGDVGIITERSASVASPLLRASLLVLAGERNLQLGKMQEADKCFEQAHYSLYSCSAIALAHQVEAYRKNAPSRVELLIREQVTDARSKANLGKLRSSMEALANFSGTEAIKAEHAVCQEVCDVLSVMFELLKKKCGNQFSPSAAPEAIREQVAGLRLSDTLAQEVYATLLMMKGAYDEAFQANPYANQPDAPDSFAVLMRDWKKRLGK